MRPCVGWAGPRSAPLELQAAVPQCMVPFAPIIQQPQEPFSMFVDLQNKYEWVLQPVVGYPSVDRLIEVLEEFFPAAIEDWSASKRPRAPAPDPAPQGRPSTVLDRKNDQWLTTVYDYGARCNRKEIFRLGMDAWRYQDV